MAICLVITMEKVSGFTVAIEYLKCRADLSLKLTLYGRYIRDQLAKKMILVVDLYILSVNNTDMIFRNNWNSSYGIMISCYFILHVYTMISEYDAIWMRSLF